MAFHHLNSSEIDELVAAAVQSGLIFQPRQLMFAFVNGTFWAGLDVGFAPRVQFRSDLLRLNDVERLEDNSVPLATYLGNGAELIAELPEAKLFRKYQNRVQNTVTGANAIVPLAALPVPAINNQAIIHQDDTLTSAFLELCLRAAKSVAKVVVPRFDSGQQYMVNGKPWLFNGTGWLIAPDLIITNHHVVNSRSGTVLATAADFDRQGRETLVQFDFDTENGSHIDVRGVASVEAADQNLDYCILRLSGDSGRAPLPLMRTSTSIAAATYLPLNIIQHPNGKSKRFALRNNLAVDADGTLLKYYTDTDYGSSGSPVMDDDGIVRALHRGAVYQNTKFQGRDTAYVNVGSQMHRILEHVGTANPALSARI